MGVFFAPNKKEAVRKAKQIAEKENREYVEPKLAQTQVKHGSGWKTWTSGWGQKKRIKQGQIVHPSRRKGNKYEAAYQPYAPGREAYFNSYADAFRFLKRKGVNRIWYVPPTGQARNVTIRKPPR